MTPQHFITKWQKVQLTERSAAQQHFLDLCDALDHPKPADADPTGEWFTFERGAAKHGGGDGWADVWKRGFFGWEYKGKHKNLDAAYDQLLQYREALESPPLLVVCDMDRLIVHTNFTATVAKTHEIPLAELGTPRNLEIMRWVFYDPEKLKPGVTSAAITAEAAGHLADIAERMRKRKLDPRGRGSLPGPHCLLPFLPKTSACSPKTCSAGLSRCVTILCPTRKLTHSPERMLARTAY